MEVGGEDRAHAVVGGQGAQRDGPARGLGHGAETTDTPSPQSGRGSPGTPECVECEVHEAVSLKSIPGYKEAVEKQKQGGKQQRCLWCNKPTSWCCRICSKGPHALAPICPAVTCPKTGDLKGQKVSHPCLGLHGGNPTFWPRGQQTANTARGAKRARGAGGASGSP